MLRQRQKAFVQYYIANGFNATRAAISAGYSRKTAYSIGHENLSKPEIRSFMEQTMKEMMDEAGAGVKWRIEMLKLAVDKAVTGQTNKDGVVDVDGVIKPIQELNKMQGTYAPTQTQNALTAVVADGTDKLDTIVELQKQDLAKFVKPQ